MVFSDLDETLVRSARRHPLADDWSPAATDKYGATVSWQSRADRTFFDWLSATARVIAVTGRSVGAYRRVGLALDGYAVVHHGAVVLAPNGQSAADYRDSVQAELDATSALLSSAAEELLASPACASNRIRVTRQVVDGRCIEVCVKATDLSADSVGPESREILRSWQSLAGIRVHHNGNNLALLPATVDKARAVRWLMSKLREEIGDFVSIGVGDSDSDSSFLAECDYAVLPRHAQLASALWERT